MRITPLGFTVLLLVGLALLARFTGSSQTAGGGASTVATASR